MFDVKCKSGLKPELKSELKAIIQQVPLLADYEWADLAVSPLSGLTNHNYLINVDCAQKNEQGSTQGGAQYVLRIPRDVTNANINRDHEAHNIEIAQQLGIVPPTIWRERCKPEQGGVYTGVSLSRYLAQAQTLTRQDFKQPEVLQQVTTSLLGLQQLSSDKKFKGRLGSTEISQQLRHYYQRCSARQQQKLAPSYQHSQQLLQTLGERDQRPAVAAHVDLVAENFLQDDHQIWLIDWEYAAMASPFWDIASICQLANFSDQQAQQWLSSFLSDPLPQDQQCLRDYRDIVECVSDCWRSAYVSDKV